MARADLLRDELDAVRDESARCATASSTAAAPQKEKWIQNAAAEKKKKEQVNKEKAKPERSSFLYACARGRTAPKRTGRRRCGGMYESIRQLERETERERELAAMLQACPIPTGEGRGISKQL